jgi:hypothetical protein
MMVAMLFVFALAGCGDHAKPMIFHKVLNIRDKPTDWEGRSVRLQGRVVGMIAMPFSDYMAYELDDTTGKIYVLTQKSLPATNEKLIVLGRVKNMMIVGTFSAGLVVLESERF